LERLFTLDAQLLFDTLVMALSMLLLVTALSFLLFNPIRDMLEKRKQRIVDDREAAKREKEEAEKLRKEYEQKLADAEKEVQEILVAARKKAMKNEAKIVAEAQEEASRILARAHTEVELERKQALDDMKQEMITIASMMAEKVIAASVDLSVQDDLLEDTLKEMGEHTWQS
jgi:F-type H+-transporting ATPase subunit b